MDRIKQYGSHGGKTKIIFLSFPGKQCLFIFFAGYQTDEIYMTEGEEGVQASRELMLPSRELQGIWENLIFDEGIKEKLLRYVNMGKHYPLLVHTFSLRILLLSTLYYSNQHTYFSNGLL